MLLKFTVLLAAVTFCSADIWFPYQRKEGPSLRSFSRNSVSLSRREDLTDSGGMMFDSDEKGSSWENHVDKIIAKGILKMTLDIDKALRSETKAEDANVLFSPVSIASALALVLLGSGGRTFQETASVMGVASGVEIASRPQLIHAQFGRLLDKFSYAHLLSRSNLPAAAGIKGYDGLELTAASGVFVQDGLTVAPTFKRVASSAYHSDVISVDFQKGGEGPSKLINGWVSDRTQGHIRDILPWKVAPAWTRVIFATALYFNGAWKLPFPEEGTSPRPFYLGALPKYVNGFVIKPSNPKPGDIIQVPMMSNLGEFPYLDKPELGFRAFGLPYGLNDSTAPVATMYFVVPNPDGNTGVSGLRGLLKRLKYTDLESIVSEAKTRPLIVSVPKMKLSSSSSLRQAISSLGLPSLFDPVTANLSGIFEESISSRSIRPSNFQRGRNTQSRKTAERTQEIGPLFADDIRHRVELELSELGTVAAAATSVALSRDGGTHITIRADRPFLFFVHHVPSGLVLFWGSITQPPVA
ncbi:serine protease inhibitor 28Dc-like [Hetaerina americana]|uniref:serine protease inhibitor 28Dc-like n=1 Tax=Hetaerina americana TaxID=62018 RepID=UPI003A7F20AF